MSVYRDKRYTRGHWIIDIRRKGHRIYKRVECSTKEQAKRIEKGILSSLKSSNLTFDDLAKKYLNYLTKTKKSPGSSYKTTSMYNKQLKKQLGDIPIDKLRLVNIKELQDVLIEQNYANSYINHIISLAISIMNYGVQYEYIEKNPFSKIKHLENLRTSDELKFCTDKEFEILMRYENDLMYHHFFCTLYLTGMRSGECKALKEKDIDFNKRLINITHHIVYANGWHDVKGRKNGMGYTIKMDNDLYTLMKEMIEHNKKIDGYHKECYIFGVVRPLSQNTPRRRLQRLCDKQGMKRLTIHSLRHSHVSYLINQGLNIYEVAERIGDTVDMVKNVYGHWFPDVQDNVVNVLNNRFDFAGNFAGKL